MRICCLEKQLKRRALCGSIRKYFDHSILNILGVARHAIGTVVKAICDQTFEGLILRCIETDSCNYINKYSLEALDEIYQIYNLHGSKRNLSTECLSSVNVPLAKQPKQTFAAILMDFRRR